MGGVGGDVDEQVVDGVAHAGRLGFGASVNVVRQLEVARRVVVVYGDEERHYRLAFACRR